MPAEATPPAGAQEAAGSDPASLPPAPDVTADQAAFAAGETAPWPTVDAPPADGAGWEAPAAAVGGAAVIAGAASTRRRAPRPREHRERVSVALSRGRPRRRRAPCTRRPSRVAYPGASRCLPVTRGRRASRWPSSRVSSVPPSSSPRGRGSSSSTPAVTTPRAPARRPLRSSPLDRRGPSSRPWNPRWSPPTSPPRNRPRSARRASRVGPWRKRRRSPRPADCSSAWSSMTPAPSPTAPSPAQDPPPGAAVRPGDTVILTIAGRGPTVLVPDVVGAGRGGRARPAARCRSRARRAHRSLRRAHPGGVDRLDRPRVPTRRSSARARSTMSCPWAPSPRRPRSQPRLRSRSPTCGVSPRRTPSTSCSTWASRPVSAARPSTTRSRRVPSSRPTRRRAPRSRSAPASPTSSPGCRAHADPRADPGSVVDPRSPGHRRGGRRQPAARPRPRAGERSEAFDDEVAAGAIVSTDPAAGTEVTARDQRRLRRVARRRAHPHAGAHPAPVAVPDLRGSPRRTPLNQLLDLGLEPGDRTRVLRRRGRGRSHRLTEPAAGTEVTARDQRRLRRLPGRRADADPRADTGSVAHPRPPRHRRGGRRQPAARPRPRAG